MTPVSGQPSAGTTRPAVDTVRRAIAAAGLRKEATT